jgi:CheY-like chemotaxis protein
LVAEDTPDQAMLINFLLTDLGARVEIVDNGAAAVEKTFKSSYDVILMDMRMPVLDGYDATRILRRDGYKRPIIALTAQALREEREKAMAAGCTSHLAKPFTQERLLGVIHSAISKESERPEVLMH